MTSNIRVIRDSRTRQWVVLLSQPVESEEVLLFSQLLSAVANTGGGIIYLTLRDGQNPDALIGVLQQVAKEKCFPPCNVEITEARKDDKQTLQIEVQHAQIPVCTFYGRLCFLNPPSEMPLFSEAPPGFHYYLLPVPECSPAHDFDSGLVDDFLRALEEKTSRVITPLGFTTDYRQKQCATLAGVLFFAKDPNRFVPHSFVQVFCDDQRVINFYDPLSRMYGMVTSYIARELQSRASNKSGVQEALRLAVDEAIKNALVHRNYAILFPIRISLNHRQISIASPGNPPEGFDFDLPYLNPHKPVNPAVYSAMEHITRVRERGVGILRMFEAMKKAGLNPPQVASETIRYHNYPVPHFVVRISLKGTATEPGSG